MDQIVQDIMRSLGTALIIAPITAYITVRLSLREYQSRWWWEKKLRHTHTLWSNFRTLSYTLELYGTMKLLHACLKMNIRDSYMNVSERHGII